MLGTAVGGETQISCEPQVYCERSPLQNASQLRKCRPVRVRARVDGDRSAFSPIWPDWRRRHL